MNLGSLLRKRRKEKGLTLEQVGKIIGVSKNTVSKYERNMIANIGRSKVIALSKLLDIPTVTFIEAIDELEKTSTEQITPRQLHFEVKELVDKTIDITDQEKTLLLQTLDFVCSEKE